MRLFRPDLGQDLSGNVIKPSLVVSFRGTPKSSKTHGIYMGIMSKIIIIYSNIPKSFLVLDHDLVLKPHGDLQIPIWGARNEEKPTWCGGKPRKKNSGNIESHMLPVWPVWHIWRKCIKMPTLPQTWPTGKYTMPKDFPGAAVGLYVLRHLFPYLIYLHVCHCCSIYLSSYLDIDRSTVNSEWNVCKTWHHQSPVICNMFQAALYTCFMTFRESISSNSRVVFVSHPLFCLFGIT